MFWMMGAGVSGNDFWTLGTGTGMANSIPIFGNGNANGKFLGIPRKIPFPFSGTGMPVANSIPDLRDGNWWPVFPGIHPWMGVDGVMCDGKGGRGGRGVDLFKLEVNILPGCLLLAHSRQGRSCRVCKVEMIFCKNKQTEALISATFLKSEKKIVKSNNHHQS